MSAHHQLHRSYSRNHAEPGILCSQWGGEGAIPCQAELKGAKKQEKKNPNPFLNFFLVRLIIVPLFKHLKTQKSIKI